MRAAERINELFNGFFNDEEQVYRELFADETRSYSSSLSVFGSLVDYSSSDFDNITDEFNTKITFLPMTTTDNEVNIYIGNYHWKCTGEAGSGKLFEGQNVGTESGQFKITPKAGTTWENISYSSSGIKNFVFPPLGIGNMSVGSTNIVGYYSGSGANQNSTMISFSYTAFLFAFYGNDSDCIITVDGSVYKDSVTDENLVVNGDGEIGVAGGGNVDAKIVNENTGIVSNLLGYLIRCGDFFSEQLSILTAVSSFLTTLGQDYFKVQRIIGEIDSYYRDRIKTTILSSKESPINIENLILPFSEDAKVEDSKNTGCFLDASFLDWNYDFYSNQISEWVLGCRLGNEYGLPYHFQVFILKPLDDFLISINNNIKAAKVAGVTYDVFTFDNQDDYDDAIGA